MRRDNWQRDARRDGPTVSDSLGAKEMLVLASTNKMALALKPASFRQHDTRMTLAEPAIATCAQSTRNESRSCRRTFSWRGESEGHGQAGDDCGGRVGRWLLDLWDVLTCSLYFAIAIRIGLWRSEIGDRRVKDGDGMGRRLGILVYTLQYHM
jgi:hypothetical protein